MSAIHVPWSRIPASGDTGGVVPPGQPSDDGDMASRLTALETTLPTLATKGDLHSLDASIKTWMIATVIGLFLGFAGLFFAMNNAARPALAPSVAQAPIVIQVPAYAPLQQEDSSPARAQALSRPSAQGSRQ